MMSRYRKGEKTMGKVLNFEALACLSAGVAAADCAFSMARSGRFASSWFSPVVTRS